MHHLFLLVLYNIPITTFLFKHTCMPCRMNLRWQANCVFRLLHLLNKGTKEALKKA